MGQPTPYTPATDFSEQEADAASGRSTVNTAALDAELAALGLTLGQVLANLALIQRDDGLLRNLSVHLESLAGPVRLLLASGAFSIDPDDASWVTGTVYPTGRIVADSAAAYLCLITHTAGPSFATDLADGKWLQVAPVIFTAAASSVEFAPTQTIAATTAQAAIEEVDRELRPASNLYMAQTYGAI